MADPYYRYSASAHRDTPALASNGLRHVASDFLKEEVTPSRPGSYGLDNVTGIELHPELAIGGVPAGSSGQGSTSVIDIDGPPVSRNESKVLFVDGLPTDCTRREVGHLFRPFIGYKDIKVIHKEPRHRGDKAMVFCFVEFVDAKCAITAMKALQGYKFDDKKPNSTALRIDFANFPLRLLSDGDEQRIGNTLLI